MGENIVKSKSLDAIDINASKDLTPRYVSRRRGRGEVETLVHTGGDHFHERY